MKTLFFLVLSSLSLSLMAAETVRFTLEYPETGCAPFKSDLMTKMNDFVASHHIDGRYTVVADKKICHHQGNSSHPDGRDRSYPCGCEMEVTLQDSSYEVTLRVDKVKPTLKRVYREEALEEILADVTSSQNHVWHNVDETFILMFKGYKVYSVFVTPKAD